MDLGTNQLDPDRGVDLTSPSLAQPPPSKASLAQQYFDAVMHLGSLEAQLDDSIADILGVDQGIKLELDGSDLYTHTTYDWYDSSFELKGVCNDYVPTPDQLTRVFALGFSRGWVCYRDHSEVYCTPDPPNPPKLYPRKTPPNPLPLSTT